MRENVLDKGPAPLVLSLRTIPGGDGLTLAAATFPWPDGVGVVCAGSEPYRKLRLCAPLSFSFHSALLPTILLTHWGSTV